MKLAIAMQNEDEIQEDHFGQAPFYAVYSLEAGEPRFVERRENPYHGAHRHAKAAEIREMLGDCRVWIGRQMGQRSVEYLRGVGILPFRVTESSPDAAIEEFLRSGEARELDASS
jgi:predicted Fe-Mo cluster-binding NifX family protein